VSKVVVIETQKQLVRVVVTQSFDVGIITTGVETVVAPTMDVVKRGVLIGSTTNLGNGWSGVLARKKLSGNTTLPITIIGVVGTLQTMFTNLIMTIHVNKILHINHR
jgi:nitrogen fixation protein